MHWSDAAIILSARKHGENSAVAKLLSREHGVYGGVVRAIHSKTNRGIAQPGNIVSATWNARLSEQLGTLKVELMEPVAALLMQDADRLTALTCACTLIESALPERHPYPRLYGLFYNFLNTLKDADEWQEDYVRFELELLAESGFGLDLSECAATGTTEDLIYVSPKSGRAVSRTAGEPYKDKLLPLPSFLRHPRLARGSGTTDSVSAIGSGSPRKAGMTAKETLAGLRLTGYFLERWLLEPHRRKLPAARSRLIEMMKETDAAEIASA